MPPATLDLSNRQRRAAFILEGRALEAVNTPDHVRRGFRFKRAAARCHAMADITMARLGAAAAVAALTNAVRAA